MLDIVTIVYLVGFVWMAICGAILAADRSKKMPDGGWHYDEAFKKRLENEPMPDDLGSKWEEDVAARFEQYIRRQREKAQEHYRRAGEIAAQPVIQGRIKRAITFED